MLAIFIFKTAESPEESPEETSPDAQEADDGEVYESDEAWAA
jgi:hypothetical protein